MRNLLQSIAALLFLTVGAAFGQPIPPELAALQPTNILPADVSSAAKLQSQSAGKAPNLVRVAAPGTAPAFRVETFSKYEQVYAVEALIRSEQAVKKGDICLARFAMRALSAQQESGEAVVNCYFQQTSAPYEKSANLQVSAGPDWVNYDVPFEVKSDAEPGQTALYFAFGSLQQSVEIKSVQVLNFGNRTTLDKLLATRFSYAGREANAAWRTKALERIQQIRTAPLNIVVTDAAGKPVAGARVEARLGQPAFIFGSEVDAALIATDTPEMQVYRDKIAELFDTVTIGNDLKWQRWMNPERRANTLRAMDWIEAKGLRLRGHNLVWPGWQFSPKRLQSLANPGVEIPRQIETHIEDEVTATRGRIWAWDVLNEPIHERDFYQSFPDTKSADWFKQARKLDPKALLFVNEYAMLNSRTSPDFIKRYLEFIKMLQANGAPLDGIGVQGHFGGQVRSPVDVLSDLDLLQTSGLPINITEFDINTKDEQLQADYTRDFLIAIFSHPGVTGFIQWGFWQPHHWKPDAAMYRADWSEKPSAKVWRDLVLNQWRTKLDATTNAQGEIASRGYLGVYEVTVTSGEKVLKHTMNLTKDRGEVRLTLP